MVGTVFRLVGLDLERQFSRLKLEAEDFKQRATDEVKKTVINVSITVGLVLVGLFLAVLTIIVGLFALYLWIAESNGPFAALGVVGTLTGVVAALLFILAAGRGHTVAPPRTRAAAPLSKPGATIKSNAGIVDTFKAEFINKTAGVTSAALDSTAELVRKSPREAIFATLAVAAMVGIFAGRRR